jgi:mRNA interferase YafQ
MKTIKKSSQFKKDIKHYANKPIKIAKLTKVIELLTNGNSLPKEYEAHKLKGQYEGCLECHIESDFLLIWVDENSDIIYLVRLGSHSELFK